MSVILFPLLFSRNNGNQSPVMEDDVERSNESTHKPESEVTEPLTGNTSEEPTPKQIELMELD